MKSLRLFILTAGILFCSSGIAQAQPAPQKLSYKVPETTWKAEIKSIDASAPFSLNDYKGKVILLLVWASWCGPCINGINDLVQIEKEFAGKNLGVVGISLPYSFDDDKQRAIELVKQSDFKFKMGWINNDVGSLLQSDLAYAPNYMLITSDGVMVERILGFNPAKTPKLLRKALKSLLKKEG
ncbi:MAG TPA: TlpA disulfide reductase family protein [Pyrinomonadaceae bacterium]|nr:TlpA disulfide reductase family protein [Pyrinomonadaceae bacterium]